MAADIRIARKGAGKVGLPEVTLGVLPGTGGTQRLTRLVGKSRAIELMTEGRNFDMDEAAELGIVNKVFEADSTDAFMDQVMEYARQFTTPGKAAMAVGHIKRAVPVGGRGRARAGARDRARAPGQALRVAGRQGRPDRVRREAEAAVRGEVIFTSWRIDHGH